MSFFQVALVKDLRRLGRDPLSLVLALGLPLVIGLLLSLVSSGNGGTPTARLLIADHDSSLVSRLVGGAFGQGPLAQMVKTESIAENEGRARMDKGKASGLLIIPDGFGDRVLKREPVTLTLLTNPSQTILPGILEQSLSALVDGAGFLQDVFGDLFTPMTEGPPAGRATFPDSQITATATAVNRIMEAAGPLLFPPAIRLETVIEEEADEAKERGFADLFFPSMFFMAILFLAQGRSDDFWHERLAGTLRRSLVAPQRLWTLLLAKATATALALAALALAGLLAGKWIFRLDLANLFPAAIWTALAGTVMYLLFTLLQNLAQSPRGGNILGNVLLFPLIMVGGSFFPFEAMPEWLARIGRLTPNGWALVRLKDLLWGRAQGGALMVGAAGLLVMGALLVFLNLVRLRAVARS